MIWTSIDIGIQHLGLLKVETTEDFDIKKIIKFDLVDIQIFHPDIQASDTGCQLHHSKCFADWMSHVFVNYSNYFDSPNIVIERQPPCGLVAIEQLIFFNYRTKCTLISPNSVHAQNGISCLDYDERKIYCEKMFLSFLAKSAPSMLKKARQLERLHDVADAFVQIRYHLKVCRDRKIKIKLNDERNERTRKILQLRLEDGSTLSEFFKRCEYRPRIGDDEKRENLHRRI
jgi:hypothetical protein|tara:strand:+ start:982 stop:1671 length:690 start_codon:yes stop_codon:yes gene_type:complete